MRSFNALVRPQKNLRICSLTNFPCKEKYVFLASSAVQQRSYVDTSAVRIIKNPTTASLKRGTGGRSSFNGIVCTVFGNSGFLGRYVCNRLGKMGTQMILPHRGDHYDVMRLKLCGDLGQVLYHPFDLRDEESIRKSIKYSNVVVNLIGRDWETKNFKFHDVHVKGAATLARLCREAGVERFIHVSALNVNQSPKPLLLKEGSQFYKSKYEGEIAVKNEFPNATIVRPALMYGQEDRFFNTYCFRWRRHMRMIPLWENGEKTIKQPIWVGDVAGGIAALVKDPDTAGKTYQFLGPERYTLADLIDWIYNLIARDRLEYGFRRVDLKYTPLFKLKVALTEALSPAYPYGMLHWEGLEKEFTTDTVDPILPTLEDLGIYPIELGKRIKWEVAPFKIEAHYAEQLGEFIVPDPPKPLPMHHHF